jgi:hypothetical protein
MFLHFCEVHTQMSEPSLRMPGLAASPITVHHRARCRNLFFEARETGKPVVEAVNFNEIGERLGSQV